MNLISFFPFCAECWLCWGVWATSKLILNFDLDFSIWSTFHKSRLSYHLQMAADENLKISDWVLSGLICMAQICFYAPNTSFFSRPSPVFDHSRVLIVLSRSQFPLCPGVKWWVPDVLDNLLFECVAWAFQHIHFSRISQRKTFILPASTLSRNP